MDTRVQSSKIYVVCPVPGDEHHPVDKLDTRAVQVRQRWEAGVSGLDVGAAAGGLGLLLLFHALDRFLNHVADGQEELLPGVPRMLICVLGHQVDFTGTDAHGESVEAL